MAKLQSNWIDQVVRLAIYMRDEFKCVYCRRSLIHTACPFDLTLDHLVPRAQGGDHSVKNLATACRSCNSRKGARSWREWATKAQRKRIIRQRRRALPVRKAATILLEQGLGDE
jgi:5-methylcytosine-specific restriction endonuclease McrA